MTWIENLNSYVICQCGCGETIKKYYKFNVRRYYKYGHSRKNRPCSELHKQKISSQNTGKTHTEKLKKHWSQIRQGRKQSKETIRKKSLSLKGHKGYWRDKKVPRDIVEKRVKNKKYTDEYRQKSRERRLKQVFPKKDSKIEKKVQLALKLEGISFKTHVPILGQPDIFIEPNICIFIDGCYFHGCSLCYNEKVLRGIIPHQSLIRDSMVNHELNEMGYIVIRIWEHTINNNDVGIAKNILNMVHHHRQKTWKRLGLI